MTVPILELCSANSDKFNKEGADGNVTPALDRSCEERDVLSRSRVVGTGQEPHILVIGGAGYIGNVLMRELLRRNSRVRCLDCLLYPTGATIAPLLDHPLFSFVRGDLRNDSDLAQSLIGVTHVVLLASLVGDPITKKYPELARDVNLRGSKKVFEALSDYPLMEKFVFTSTCSNYGIFAGEGSATEEAPLDPRSVYAETKVAFEELVLANVPNVHFCSTILRLSTAFGLSSRMRFDLTVSEFARELALGKELLVYDERTWRPYCHVLDISDAIIRVLAAPRTHVFGQIYNVGGDDHNYTKEMLVNEIKKVVQNARVSYNVGGVDPRDYRVSFDKIKRVLEYEPQHSISDTISKIVHGVSSGLFDDVEERPEFYGNYLVRSTR